MSTTPEADRLAALTDAELMEEAARSAPAPFTAARIIAEMVTENLSQSVIPSSIPAGIGDWVRRAARHGAWRTSFVLNAPDPAVLFIEFTLNPDGTIHQEMRDTNNCPFWSGTFRPCSNT